MAASFCSTRRIALAFAATILIGGMLSVTAMAEDLGPAVGIKAPDIGTRLDQTGRPRTLSHLMGKNGVVLLVFRSAYWCPYCQVQLIAVNGGGEAGTKRCYQVAGRSYDMP